jgi:hypothetical protein
MKIARHDFFLHQERESCEASVRVPNHWGAILACTLTLVARRLRRAHSPRHSALSHKRMGEGKKGVSRHTEDEGFRSSGLELQLGPEKKLSERLANAITGAQ